VLEGYTTVRFLAGVTETMRLGLLVTGVAYRHPGLLAKISPTLDVVSAGRAMLGIGAAWYEREHDGLAEPTTSPTKRSPSNGDLGRRPIDLTGGLQDRRASCPTWRCASRVLAGAVGDLELSRALSRVTRLRFGGRRARRVRTERSRCRDRRRPRRRSRA
jgi:hypothetical protein